MDCKNRIIKLRESTGLNRKDFCKLVHIPYRTMTEWELDNRHAPDYVLWLLEYYIRNEGLMVKEMDEGGHRVEFGEVSGHRVLIKRGPGNRGPTECGTPHEATSGMSS